MNSPLQPTDEQIAAAQLRLVLDEKLGRQTSEIIREIATHRPAGDQQPSTPWQPPVEGDPTSLRLLRRLSDSELSETLAKSPWDTRWATLFVDYVDIGGSNPRAEVHLVDIAGRSRRVDILTNLGRALRESGRPAEAAQVFEEALALDPGQQPDNPDAEDQG